MKSVNFNENAQYLVGIALLMPSLPVRQGGVLALQHLQQSHIKVPEIAEGQHDVWQQGCLLGSSLGTMPRLTDLKGLGWFLMCYHGTNK